MVNFMIKWQNNRCSAFLFKKKMPLLLAKGILIADLLNSNIFCFDFDFDEWPATHTEHEHYRRPYTGSLFELRDHYRTIFHEPRFKPIDIIENGG